MLHVATARPPLGPGITGKYDYELGALSGSGLGDVELDAALTLVLSFVHGAARPAAEAVQVASGSGQSDEQWWRASAPILEQVLDPAAYPLATRVGAAAGEAYQAASDPAGAFEFGLARVLDGLGVFIAGRAAAG
jgi:hypothetical protein